MSLLQCQNTFIFASIIFASAKYATAFTAPSTFQLKSPSTISRAGLRMSVAVPAPKIGKPVKPVKLPDLSQSQFPDVPDEGYDFVVLGSGPGGETAAVHAAQLGAKVAVVEVKKSFGGPTGLTSKAVREATKQIVQTVNQVGGDRRRQIRRLWTKRFPALRGEAEVMQAAETRERLLKNRVDLFIGAAELVPPEESMSGKLSVRVCRPTGCVELPTSKICVATGGRAHRAKELAPGVPIPFTKGIVIDSTEMGQISNLPNAAAVIGGGIIAVEYATVLAKLGVGVSLLCKDEEFMPFLPPEVKEALRQRMIKDRVLFIDSDIKRIDVGSDNLVRVQLEPKPRQPKRVRVDLVLYSGGRDANTEGLMCEKVGVKVGTYGRIMVDKDCRTANPAIFAVGDVTNPGLASTAAFQARTVTDLMFRGQMLALAQTMLANRRSASLDEAEVDDFFSEDDSDHDDFAPSPAPTGGETLFAGNPGGQVTAPLTLWTIPEIASVGQSAEEAAAAGVNVVAGYGYFKDLARGRLSDIDGWLKLIARAEGPTRHVIIGVHIVGEGANELIQLGSILVHSQATLEQVSNTPFAAVTLSGLYQVASDDGLCASPLNFQRQPERAKAFMEAMAKQQ